MSALWLATSNRSGYEGESYRPDLKTIEYLLQKGADANEDGLLWNVIHKDKVEVVKLLLKYGAVLGPEPKHYSSKAVLFGAEMWALIGPSHGPQTQLPLQVGNRELFNLNQTEVPHSSSSIEEIEGDLDKGSFGPGLNYSPRNKQHL
jgi:hypothetical protein